VRPRRGRYEQRQRQEGSERPPPIGPHASVLGARFAPVNTPGAAPRGCW
jgi:hypothetical protein